MSASGPKVLKACGPQRLQSGKKQTNISTESLWGPEAMISNEDPAFDIYHDPQRLMDKSKADRAKRQPTEKSNPASRLHTVVDKIIRSREVKDKELSQLNAQAFQEAKKIALSAGNRSLPSISSSDNEPALSKGKKTRGQRTKNRTVIPVHSQQSKSGAGLSERTQSQVNPPSVTASNSDVLFPPPDLTRPPPPFSQSGSGSTELKKSHVTFSKRISTASGGPPYDGSSSSSSSDSSFREAENNRGGKDHSDSSGSYRTPSPPSGPPDGNPPDGGPPGDGPPGGNGPPEDGNPGRGSPGEDPDGDDSDEGPARRTTLARIPADITNLIDLYALNIMQLITEISSPGIRKKTFFTGILEQIKSLKVEQTRIVKSIGLHRFRIHTNLQIRFQSETICPTQLLSKINAHVIERLDEALASEEKLRSLSSFRQKEDISVLQKIVGCPLKGIASFILWESNVLASLKSLSNECSDITLLSYLKSSVIHAETREEIENFTTANQVTTHIFRKFSSFSSLIESTFSFVRSLPLPNRYSLMLNNISKILSIAEPVIALNYAKCLTTSILEQLEQKALFSHFLDNYLADKYATFAVEDSALISQAETAGTSASDVFRLMSARSKIRISQEIEPQFKKFVKYLQQHLPQISFIASKNKRNLNNSSAARNVPASARKNQDNRDMFSADVLPENSVSSPSSENEVVDDWINPITEGVEVDQNTDPPANSSDILYTSPASTKVNQKQQNSIKSMQQTQLQKMFPCPCKIKNCTRKSIDGSIIGCTLFEKLPLREQVTQLFKMKLCSLCGRSMARLKQSHKNGVASCTAPRCTFCSGTHASRFCLKRNDSANRVLSMNSVTNYNCFNQPGEEQLEEEDESLATHMLMLSVAFNPDVYQLDAQALSPGVTQSESNLVEAFPLDLSSLISTAASFDLKESYLIRRVDKLPSPTKEDLDAYDLQYGIKKELIIQQLSPHAFNCSDSQWSSLNDRKWNHIRQDFDCIRPLIIPSYDEKRILEEIDNHPPEIQFSDHFFPMTTTQHSVFSLSNIPVEDLDKAIENESFNSVFIKESCFDQSHSNDNIVVVNSLNTTFAGVDQTLVDGTPLDPVLDSTHETLSTDFDYLPLPFDPI